MKSFAIVGAGAVGSYYGGRLAQAGNDVRFLLRSDFEEVRKNGLRVESIHGDFELSSVTCAPSPEEIGPVDVVIVAWKATSNHHFQKVLPPLLHDDTIILTLQNGLGNIELLSELFGAERVLGAMCFVCINRIEAGLIRHTASGMIAMGEARPGLTPRLEKLAAVFEKAKVECQIVENFSETQWKKLVWNIPFNGLCITEGGIDTGALLAQSDGEAKVREIMLEVQSAAAALGHQIADSFIEHQIARTYPMNDYRPSSMIDFVNGQPVEIEAIWSEPLWQAEAAGAAVPKLRELEQAIRAAVDGRNA